MHFFPSPASKNIGVPGTIPQDFKRSDVLAALQKEEKRKERISKDQMIWHLAVSAEPLSPPMVMMNMIGVIWQTPICWQNNIFGLSLPFPRSTITSLSLLAPGSVCRAALPSNGGESDSYRSLLSHLGNDEDDDQGQLNDNDT